MTTSARRRAFFALWALGLVGVVAFLPAVASLLPPPPADRHGPPLAVLLLAAVVQNALIAAGASAIVVRLGPAVGLRAPVVEAWAVGAPRSWQAPLRGLVGPGLLAGALGAVFAKLSSPHLVRYLVGVPLVTRILYGGIVEELILRGGLLTLLAWILHRLTGRIGEPSRWLTGAAILVSNAVFAVGHLPVLIVHHDPSPPRTVAVIFVVALPWGWLYARRGLEAASIAHATFHVVVAALASLRG
jgi:hypothetical protein